MVSNVFITAATSQLGSLIVKDLLNGAEKDEIQVTVGVRDPSKVPEEWKKAGVKVEKADYTEDSEKWSNILKGQERIVLISSNTQINSGRFEQHKNVIEGAKKAGVKLLAYTSIVNADQNKMILAEDHLRTEEYLKSSGLQQYILLRNGWYIENFFMSSPGWPHTKTLFSASGKAKYSLASRADYASAAAAILRPSFKPTKVAYELAGDQSYSLDQFVEIVSKFLPFQLNYQSLSKEDFTQALIKNHIPEHLANVLADSDIKAERDQALVNDSKDLSNLIGRPTESIEQVASVILKQ